MNASSVIKVSNADKHNNFSKLNHACTKLALLGRVNKKAGRKSEQGGGGGRQRAV